MRVNKLLDFLKKDYYWFNMTHLEYIASNDDKGRYSFNEDKTKIKANQGHSVMVKIEFKISNPPDILYHGISSNAISTIMHDGIKSMYRQFVHLSSDLETVKKVGKRHGSPIVLAVSAGDMTKDGYQFKLSDNNVWLIEEVTVKYIKVIEDKRR